MTRSATADPAHSRRVQTRAEPRVARATRRTQQDRTADARSQLLNAAIDVLMERGYGGLTTREVARRAGFSNGALIHHYRTKADLVVAATTYAFEQAMEPSRRVAATIDSANEPIKAFVEDIWQVYFDWTFTIMAEVLVVARTDPALMARVQPIMRQTRMSIIGIWKSAFARAGLPEERCDMLITLTLLIVRGMAVDDIWMKDKARLKNMLSLWGNFATAQLSDAADDAASRPSPRAGKAIKVARPKAKAPSTRPTRGAR